MKLSTLLFAILGALLVVVGGIRAQDLAGVYNEKLKQIILPNIEFRSTTLGDAVEFLKQESRRLDPTTTDKDWAGVPVSVEVDAQTLNTRLTLTFSRIPLSEAFQYVAQQARAKIKVDAKGVHVLPQQAAAQSAQSTPDPYTPSFDRARAMYPEIAQPDSPLGKAAREEMTRMETSRDPLIADPRVPEIVATRVAGRLGIAPVVIGADSQRPTPTAAITSTPSFDASVAASKARMNAKYPDLNKSNSFLFQKVVATIQQWKTTVPNYFKDANWPEGLVETCVQDFATRPPFTGESVKAMLIQQLRAERLPESQYGHGARNQQLDEQEDVLKSGAWNDDMDGKAARFNANFLRNLGLSTAASTYDSQASIIETRCAERDAKAKQERTAADAVAQQQQDMAALRGQLFLLKESVDSARRALQQNW